MSKKFKIAIIGCGARSIAYAKNLTASSEVELVACAEPDREHLRTMLSYTSVKEEDLRIYDDWKALCDNEKSLDGAVIVTPNYLHHQPASEIIRRGIPLVLEKPLTTTMKDSESLLEVVRDYRPQMLVGFVLRSTPFSSFILPNCKSEFAKMLLIFSWLSRQSPSFAIIFSHSSESV